MRFFVLAASLAALSIAAGCSRGGGNVQTAALALPAAPKVQRAVEVKKAKPNPNAVLNGRWEPTDADGKRLYYLELKNGGLASRSPSSGATTARGTYTVTGKDKVAITYQSSLSSTPLQLNCSVAGGTRMSCASADGSNAFSLVRA